MKLILCPWFIVVGKDGDTLKRVNGADTLIPVISVGNKPLFAIVSVITKV